MALEESSSMRPSIKLALMGGEVTLLATFTGIGIHLAMQPHRVAFRPPPLVLPSLGPLAATPAPLVKLPTTPKATPATPAPLVPEVFAKFGQQDHNLVLQQWDLLQRLTTAIGRYVEARVNEQLAKR